ncbi:MAG: hypothetical protein V4819_06775 [Verrucomicrobiota bacterium]
MATNSENTSGKSELEQMFPAMRPVKSPPSLFTINGFGLGMYGKRAFDAPTGTYIKTRCLCALFVPLFPLDAYRVANAQGGGWYFLGKEKIAGFAKVWRWCASVAVILAIATAVQTAHTHSPEYRAGKAREKAVALASSGHPFEAAEVYQDLLREGIGSAAEWRGAMSALVRKEISSGDAKRASAAVHYADLNKNVGRSPEPLIPDLADLALEAASKCADPADAEKILSSFRPETSDLTRVHQELRKALESLHGKQPDDQDVRIKLALIREEFGEVDGALDLLTPAAAKLADGEGARLYGHLLLGENRAEEALAHLERYLKRRTADWTRAGEMLQSTYDTARARELAALNTTGGPSGFRARYDAAGESEQQQMVEEYLSGQLAKDRVLLAARERYRKSTSVVPAIMDLGVARLRVAQAEKDVARRKEFLTSAEQAFLTLKSVAGESDEYRLFLGQIYFWSGRETAGRALFDELLVSKQRDLPTLYGLANVFRDLGESNDACKLLEEAFPKARNGNEKALVIGLRAILARSTDEKIEWLSKGDASTPGLEITLLEARGRKAEESGDVEQAKRCYYQALAGYEKQGRTSANLNNAALLYREIYQLDGKQADFEKAARLLSEAVELEPANSILAFNAASSLLDAAVIRVAGERVPAGLLQFDMGISSLQFLYGNESEKASVITELQADPNFRKSLGHFWEALLLSPKSTELYGWGVGVFHFIGDEAALERLLAKAVEQEFDFTGQKQDLDRYLKKERDAEIKTTFAAQGERIGKLEAGLKDSRAKAMVQAPVTSIRLSGYAIGEDTKVDSWLADLRRAVEVAPSSRLRASVEAALEIAALEKLAKEDKECAGIIEADRRLLGSSHLLRLLVRARGDLGERVRKHPAVVAAREANYEVVNLFPSNFGFDDWLLAEGLHPEADSRLAALYAANKSEILTNRLGLEIQDHGPSVLFTLFWTKTLEGDVIGAKELLPQMQAAGLQLPQMF